MRRTLQWAGAVVGSLLLAILPGCQQEIPPPSPLALMVDGVAGDPSPEEAAQFLEAIAEAPDEDLRVFERSESQFANAPQAERDALMQVYIDRSRNLGRLTHAGVERAKALHAQGSAEEARAILDDIERIGRANTGPPEEIVQIGAITGEAILRRVAEAREALAADESDDPPPPEGAGGV